MDSTLLAPRPLRLLSVPFDTLRLAVRLPLLVSWVLIGLLVAFAMGLVPRLLPPRPIARIWATGLLRIFGVRVRLHGRALQGAHLQVANHVSWLDMFVLATNGHYRYVAKSEVSRWPVARTLANCMGTVYIDRKPGGAAPVLAKTTAALEAGGFFLFFPEGTTTDGHTLKDFHPRLFNAATASKSPVQAIAIRYQAAPRRLNVAPFIGTDTLVAHILRLLANPGLQVEVYYCDSISGNDPADLAQRSRQAIAGRLAGAIKRPRRSVS